MSEIKNKIKKALTKKAVGYESEEVVEEYQDVNGELVLVKKKITKKYVPPDNQAAKLVLDEINEKTPSLTAMTDEELEAEKARLLAELKAGKNS